MDGRKRLKLYMAGVVLAAGALWTCWWWLTSEYSPLLDSPSLAPPRPVAVPRAPAAVPAAAKPQHLPSKPGALIQRLSAGADQPGVVVCEPVARGADPGIARFGTGCSRWLSFALSGVPALGSTPSWGTIATVLPTMGLRDLRLSAEQARRLARPLGVPYAAVGEISGTPARAVLTYRLYEIPSGKAKGRPVTVTGTLEAVTGKLPAVAAGMLRAANVPEARVGEGLAETASTLTELGAFPWRAEAGVPKELEKLSYRSPLASMVMLTRMDVWDMMFARQLQEDLVERFPGHPLVLQMATLCADVNVQQGNLVLGKVIKSGEEIRRQYPFSCLTQMALATAYWRCSRFDDARDAAEAAVVSCNRSAEAWSLLATVTDTLAADAASAANHAAYASAMAQVNTLKQGARAGNGARLRSAASANGAPTPGGNTPALPGGRTSEQDAWYRGMLFRRQVAPLFRRAVALDDRRWDIWRNYCSAACRDGDWATASAAFWKAAPLCAGDSDTIHAGLDLWGEWHPQPKEFQRVVEFALAHPSASRFQRRRLAVYFAQHHRAVAASTIGLNAPPSQIAQLITVSRRVVPRPARWNAPGAPSIKTPPPADLAHQKIAGPWLIGKPGGRLYRLAWNPEGSALAAADGWPGPVVWKGGNSVRRFGGAPPGWMYDVAWTSSGELVGAMQDGQLAYWNAAREQVLRTVHRPRGASARAIALRPSGDRIILRDERRFFSLFSMPDQRRIPMLFATPGYVSDAAFSPDGALLATLGTAGSGIVSLRSSVDGRELRRIELSADIERMAWRPDGKAIAVSASDSTLRVIDLDGKELTSRQLHHRPLCMAWGPAGKLLAFGMNDGTFQTWNPATGELRQSPQGHRGAVQLLAWDLHGDRIATWAYDGTLLLWNPNAFPLAPTVPEPPTAETTVLSLWKTITMPDRAYGGRLRFTPDARALAAAGSSAANLYEVDTGHAIREFKSREGEMVDQVFFAPDRKAAYGVGIDAVWAWDGVTAQERWTRKRPRAGLTFNFASRGAAALSPDGRWLAAALPNGEPLHVWDAATGQDRKQLPVCGTPLGVQFSPDGRWLAVAYGSLGRWADIDLYDTRTFARVGTLAGHQDRIIALCFSPDGAMLASLAMDRTARIWDIAGRKPLLSLPAIGNLEGSVAFLSGGKRLFVQSGIQVRTWEVPTGKLLQDVQLKRENISAFTFSADGKLAANSIMNNLREQKRTLQVWRVVD